MATLPIPRLVDTASNGRVRAIGGQVLWDDRDKPGAHVVGVEGEGGGLVCAI
jgi:hypothetical protein